MFNRIKKSTNWFPGQTNARDRWGDLVGSEIQGREFRSVAGNVENAAQRMRWSLGHA